MKYNWTTFVYVIIYEMNLGLFFIVVQLCCSACGTTQKMRNGRRFEYEWGKNLKLCV